MMCSVPLTCATQITMQHQTKQRVNGTVLFSPVAKQKNRFPRAKQCLIFYQMTTDVLFKQKKHTSIPKEINETPLQRQHAPKCVSNPPRLLHTFWVAKRRCYHPLAEGGCVINEHLNLLT